MSIGYHLFRLRQRLPRPPAVLAIATSDDDGVHVTAWAEPSWLDRRLVRAPFAGRHALSAASIAESHRPVMVTEHLTLAAGDDCELGALAAIVAAAGAEFTPGAVEASFRVVRCSDAVVHTIVGAEALAFGESRTHAGYGDSSSS